MKKDQYTPISLSIRFTDMKDWLPKSRLSRWAAFRGMFVINSLVVNWPALRAIWELKDYGEKTRSRWVEEYRHQRILSGISQDKDYSAILSENKQEIDFPVELLTD